jgi:delta14-sterol reductase
MYFYVVGGTMLSLNALSGAAYHYDRFGDDANPGVFLYAGFFTFYILDYFVFERVQLFTFDIIEERVGLKLIFGCLALYPLLYPIGLWGTAGLPSPDIDPALNPLWLGGSAAVFLLGWVITRGANMQKYTFKRFPERAFLGFIKPVTMTNGERTILCSGYWGAARHVNYTGEILEALGMALALGHFTNAWAWIYFVYLTIFFIVRDRIDDGRCALKYGDLWAQYRAKTPYRLVPGIY